MKLFRFALLAMLLASIFGCRKSNELLEADIQAGDAEFAIPLLKARTSIQDLLEKFDDYTYIEIDSAGVVHLRYQGDVLTQTADEFFNVIDTFLPVIIPIKSPLFILDFDSVGSQLKVDFARYSTGSVNASVYTEYQGLVNFSLTIHEATKNGQPLTIQSQFMAPIGFQINGTHIPIPPDLNAAVPVYGYELQPIDGKVHIEYAAL
ncbi:MAG: hypothetical protein IT258_04465, partial [Saprospiraceae bacterium]|nr:hypothetical protein [Saprospiraceae bacterium]